MENGPGLSRCILGGGNSNIFFAFYPENWGFMILFDWRIFFKWVVKNQLLAGADRDEDS